jgi:hypothetical protein
MSYLNIDKNARQDFADNYWNHWNGDKLIPDHWEELKGSGISHGVATINFRSLGQSESEAFILSSPELPRTNTGRLAGGMLWRYGNLSHGGWAFQGSDPLNNWEPMQWGCLKPNKPWKDKQGKTIKYEHPAKTPTRAFFPVPDMDAWQKISTRYDVAIASDAPFWQWVKDTPTVPVIITEGAKKAASLVSHGFVAVGLPGIFNGHKSKDEHGNPLAHPHLIPELDSICQPKRRIYIAFDNDKKPKTIASVNNASQSLAYLIDGKGCFCRIMQWKHLAEKGIDDVIVAHGGEIISTLIKKAVSVDYIRLEYYRNVKGLPNVHIINRRFIGEISPPDDANLICGISPTGTGKSFATNKLAEQAKQQGIPVVAITHRTSLEKKQSSDFGIPYRNNLDGEWDGYDGYATCFNSMHSKASPPFNSLRYDGALVIIDEVVQVISEMLNSGLVKSERAEILYNFSVLIKNASKVVILDANLNRAVIDLFLALIGSDAKPYILINEWQRENKRKLFVYDSPEELLAVARKMAKEGKNIAFHLGAQKPGSELGTINLEKLFSPIVGAESILRVDSETTGDTDHPACGFSANANEVAKNYKILIGSPSIETALSIEGDHFDAVFCIANGVQPPESIMQTVARVRNDCDRHIYIQDYSNKRIGNGSRSPSKLLKSQQRIFKTNLQLLGMSDGIIELELGGRPNYLITWATLGAMANYDFVNYPTRIIELLEGEGYTPCTPPQPISEGEATAIKEEVKASANQAHSQWCEDVSKAKILDPVSLKALQKKRTRTKDERLSEQATAIATRYATDAIDPELADRDSGHGWHGKLLLHYFLTVGNDYLPDRDKKRLESLAQGTGDVFIPDANRGTLTGKVRALQHLNIDQFFTGEEFTSEGLQDWFGGVCRMAGLKDLIGTGVHSEKDTPIGFAQRLLGLLGLKMDCTGQRTLESGKRQRVYQLINTNPDNRNDIFERWLDRDSLHTPLINKISIPYVHTPSDSHQNSKGAAIA